MQSTLNKVQVDHDVDIALRSSQRGTATKSEVTFKIICVTHYVILNVIL